MYRLVEKCLLLGDDSNSINRAPRQHFTLGEVINMPEYVAVYSSPGDMPTVAPIEATSKVHAEVKANAIASDADKPTTVKVFTKG
jgi:hypothetical protein